MTKVSGLDILTEDLMQNPSFRRGIALLDATVLKDELVDNSVFVYRDERKRKWDIFYRVGGYGGNVSFIAGGMAYPYNYEFKSWHELKEEIEEKNRELRKAGTISTEFMFWPVENKPGSSNYLGILVLGKSEDDKKIMEGHDAFFDSADIDWIDAEARAIKIGKFSRRRPTYSQIINDNACAGYNPNRIVVFTQNFGEEVRLAKVGYDLSKEEWGNLDELRKLDLSFLEKIE